ncbi:MAG: ribosome maturation factor RimP [Actinomycetota bacterium]|nr:ribosome maturation factor RimP [Actinomycetota bacterium]
MLPETVHRSFSDGEAWADAHASFFRDPRSNAAKSAKERVETMGVADRVDNLVEPLCARVGVEMIDVEFAEGVLRITVDQSGGVDTEALATLTREVSRALDHTDPIPGAFTLEITSPGLERPLKRPAHFENVVGTRIRLKTLPGTEGDRRLEGVLESASDTGVVIRADDGTVQTLVYEEVQTARTVFVWEREPKSVRRGRGGDVGRTHGRMDP